MRDAGDLFDNYSDSYNGALSTALAPSGENREYFAEERIKWLKKCLIGLKENPRAILDFGCGDGSTTPLLQQNLKAEIAVGVDVSVKSLDSARKHFANSRITYTPIEAFAARTNRLGVLQWGISPYPTTTAVCCSDADSRLASLGGGICILGE